MPDDILAHAPTGSGKTASFLLPIIKCIADEKKRTGVNIIPSTPFALILSPTKELAMQLAEDAQKFARGLLIGSFSSICFLFHLQ